MAYLLVRAGDPAGVQFPLDTERVVVGRADAANIQLSHSFISSSHAEILEKDGHHLIRDLNSTNGTKLNDSKLSGNPVPLKNGDLVVLANDTVRLQYVSDDDGTIVMTAELADLPGLFRVDEGAREVFVGDRMMAPALTWRLFDVLNLLFRHEGNVCSSSAIKRIGWSDRRDGAASANELNVLMGRLRRKLRAFIPERDLIQNVVGIGYKLVLPNELKGKP